MGAEDPLWRARRLTLLPTGSGGSYRVELKDEAGSTVAACDAEGTIGDPSGRPLLRAPLRWAGRDDKPTNARVEMADPAGATLAVASVAKYGVGPRARKATIEVVDAGGAPVLRLEPRDGRGDQLALSTGDIELATIAVEQVKTGFLRKSRVYAVEIGDQVTPEIRPLVVATAIRYDALLNAVMAAVARERNRD